MQQKLLVFSIITYMFCKQAVCSANHLARVYILFSVNSITFETERINSNKKADDLNLTFEIAKLICYMKEAMKKPHENT